MKKIFNFLFNKWTFAILGLLSISLLIWYAGPLIAFADYRPLQSETVRGVLIAIIVGFYFGKLLIRFVKARNLNAKLIEGLLHKSSSEQKPQDQPGKEEVAVLHKRFEDAVAVLKQANFKTGAKKPLLSSLSFRQYLYDLPWYIFIGAPGSGKTTALINSGLQFPLAERFGKKAISGIGGTRDCDWWFTNEAVLLDTAGRYTTQESNHLVDSTEWNSFLQLLKKYRPHRPINGVFVTISAADLLQQTPAQREAHANALRHRIQELHERLNIRFPLYVLVTKTDLLAGFMEFFSDYGKEERGQVWGVTFPPSEQDDESALENYAPEFALLEQRLNERLIEYLQQERSLPRRELIYAFPQQFSVLKEVLGDFLNLVFSPSRFDQQPLLRGVYLTSGTQEGNPIDRVMGRLGRALNLENKLLTPNSPMGKSFFIARLIKNVIFPEAELAGTNLQWERKQNILQWAGLFVVSIFTLGMVAAWAISYSNNISYIAEVEEKLPTVAKQVATLPNIHEMDIASLLASLKATQHLALTDTISYDNEPVSMGFGLYQGHKLLAASNNTYDNLLREALLPRLVLRIEHLLTHASHSNLELLYEGLKAYLMLHSAEFFDPVALKAFIITDWETNLQREFTNQQRQDLESHLDQLLRRGHITSPIPVNQQLIANIRDIVSRTPIAQRIYGRLKIQGVGNDIPEFTITKAVGSAASLVFTRDSGEPLHKGVPGLFSYKGYYEVFNKKSREIAKQLADEETWVLGIKENNRSTPLSNQSDEALYDHVRRLYLQDYRNIWDNFIKDIKLVHTTTLQDSLRSARILSATDSPLPILLNAIVKEVTLVNIDEAKKNVVNKAADRVKSASDKLKILLGHTEETSTATIVSRPEHIVDDHFNDLRNLVYSAIPGQPAPIQAVIAQIDELYMLLNTTDVALRSGDTPPPSDVPAQIRGNATRFPEPIRSMLNTLSSSGISHALGQQRSNLNQSLTTNITEFCRKATLNRYPFSKASAQDVTQEDFARLFSPGGLFDSYFQDELVQYIDTSTRPWRFRKVGDASMGHASQDLQEFYRARLIRDVFFHSGGRTAGIEFSFRPIDMDASITQFILDVDGQLVKYSHGPQVPISVKWPGPKGSSQVRLQISPANESGASGQVFDGPWALFRMFDGIHISPSSQPEKFFATFNIHDRKIQFEVITSSVQNPFRLRELEQFNCPKRL